ncbi:MAG: hypothetical protein JSV17_09225 [Candidatus Aminicenantes bacterium]|nr:MAG: hypothetical protein JSV17_09225 [Candidatus Aminicenantes bacterium]
MRKKNPAKSIQRITSAFVITGVLLLFLGCKSNSGPTEPDDRSVLRLIASTLHFEYYFDGPDQSQIQSVMNALEGNYDRITSDLAAFDMPVVRAKIWSDGTGFYNTMEEDLGRIFAGAKGYVMGPDELRLLLTHRGDVNAVHEFVHCVSLHLNDTIANNPRWLWETVALYLSQDFINPNLLSYMKAGNYPTIDDLNSSYNLDQSVYEVGYVLGEYIVENWGIVALRDLLLQNGDIQAVLGISVQDLETGWFDWLEKKYLPGPS